MAFVHEQDCLELKDVSDGEAFSSVQSMCQSGISIMKEQYPDCSEPILKPESGDFAKWLRSNHSQINLVYEKPGKRLLLRGNDYWMPLVFLASDISLPIYLNLVSSYVYEKMKGSLPHEKARVHVEVVFQDKKNGVLKSFKYEGDINGLEKSVGKFDINKFMD